MNTVNNTLDQVLTQAVKDCTNVVKIAELETIETRNLTGYAGSTKTSNYKRKVYHK